MNELLLVTAACLGLLAFFEPCTIATHTLFSARVAQKTVAGQTLDLLLIWAVRSLLLAGLFVLATWLAQDLEIPAATAAYALVIMALVYLVSRRVYIPVPHIEFFRLLPAAGRLPDAVRLGLTAPACTLPLLVILLVLVMRVDSPALALVSGILFASFFSLPIVLAASNGATENTRDFFSKAASSAPYLTAFLLLSAAAWLLLPEINLEKDALLATLQQAGFAAIGIAFLAGFVFSFNPVSFASIPVVLAYVTRAREKRQALSLGGAFIFGMIITHVALGMAAASGGEWAQSVMGRQWGLLLGPVLIVLGLVWPGWLKLKLPWLSMRGQKVSGHWGAFLLAIPFSIAICPFCAPALVVALTASAAVGSVAFGAVLLLAFAIGRSIPILLGAWSVGWLESLQVVGKHHHVFEIIGGVVLILSGLYMLNEYLFIIQY